MSLIQEALRRQHEDDGSEAAPSPLRPKAPAEQPEVEAPPPPEKISTSASEPAPPPVARPPLVRPAKKRSLRDTGTVPPPPLPEEEAETPTKEFDEGKPAPVLEQQRRKPLATVVGVILILLLLAAGAVWGIMYGFQSMLGPSTADNAGTGPDTTAPVPLPAAVMPTENAEEPPDLQPGVSPPAPVDSTPVADGDTTPAVKPPVAPHPTPAVQPPPSDFQAAEPKDPVKWPLVTVKGVVGRGLNGSAMLNGKVLAVGEQIEGVTVISIQKNGVTLEYEGEKRFLKVGNTSR